MLLEGEQDVKSRRLGFADVSEARCYLIRRRTFNDASSSFNKLVNKSTKVRNLSSSHARTALASSVRSGPESRPFETITTKTLYSAYMALDSCIDRSLSRAMSRRSASGFREEPLDTAVVSCFSRSWTVLRATSSVSRVLRFFEGSDGGISQARCDSAESKEAQTGRAESSSSNFKCRP